MIEKMPQAVRLVNRVLRALEDSQQKMDGVSFCPITFFQHPALEGWLPEAKALIQHIENVKARNRAAYAYIQHIEGKPHD